MKSFGNKTRGSVVPVIPFTTPGVTRAGSFASGTPTQQKPSQSLAAPSPVLNFNSAAMAASKQREQIRMSVFRELLEVVDLPDLMKMTPERARDEVADVIRVLLTNQQVGLDISEQDAVVSEIINDVLGLGPLEQLLARDDIADIMIYGPNKVHIEVGGKLELTDIKFRDEAQLRNICSRIVAAVGRRVDESSPICDARLMDGSRVAIMIPPLSIDGTSMTIRKFKKDKLTLENLVQFGSISEAGAAILKIISEVRCNVLISGGTGSGKTTLLNCLTRYIRPNEAIITCEDAAELQLQQHNVRRWETRPKNLEGVGEVDMSTLVKAALRHRPERIIIGEVRGKEAFDLLQAMNTGHDGSAGTVHSNSPREAISRLESMIAQGGFNLPAKAVREQIASSVDVIIQATRMRDGSRKVTHITEVVGMEGDVVTLMDLMVFEHTGEDKDGNIIGHYKAMGVRPHMFEKARYYGLDKILMNAMQTVTF